MANPSDMTLDELKQLIAETVDQRLRQVLSDPTPKRSWADIREVVARVRWIPPDGAPSARSVLREDRER